MYVVKADALDRDGNRVSVYLANSATDAPLTLSQRDAARFDTRDAANAVARQDTSNGFRPVKLRPRS